MNQTIKISTGEEFIGFIPLRFKLKYLFSLGPIPVECVLWKNKKTRKIYRYDWESKELILKDAVVSSDENIRTSKHSRTVNENINKNQDTNIIAMEVNKK